jgi:hypothetical protein
MGLSQLKFRRVGKLLQNELSQKLIFSPPILMIELSIYYAQLFDLDIRSILV